MNSSIWKANAGCVMSTFDRNTDEKITQLINYVLIQIIALLASPMFEALEIPYDSKLISKTNHRLNLHILKNVSMKKYLVIFEKYQLI